MSVIEVPKWVCGKSFAMTTVNSWHEFVALIETDFLDWDEYVFRGQKKSEWPLRSKFDRTYKESVDKLEDVRRTIEMPRGDEYRVEKLKLDSRNKVLGRLLDTFKKVSLGRRGSSPKELSDIEWWSLGQHFGLSTPLLDWSKSPYVAAYFAFNEADPKSKDYRAIWAYSHDAMLEIFTHDPTSSTKLKTEEDSIVLISSATDENSRIVSQNGMFTRTPNGEDVEEFIEKNLHLNGMAPVLYKIEIPNSLRESFLRHLELMNVHAGSLFPDLQGAAEYANRSLERETENLLWSVTPSFKTRLLRDDICHGMND